MKPAEQEKERGRELGPVKGFFPHVVLEWRICTGHVVVAK
jgi:hypothetical protein